jgi:histidinol phosphatase-like enzyme
VLKWEYTTIVGDPACDLQFDESMAVRLQVRVKGGDERRVIERKGDESEVR